MFLRTIGLGFGLFISTVSFAQSTSSIARCKKQDWLVPTSYLWVEINQLSDGKLSFLYGNGIDSQLIEVHFESPILEMEEGKFSYQSDDYQLDARIIKGKLQFDLVSRGRKLTRKNFVCL